MPVIVGIPGSLRRGSFNAALLRHAATVMPPGWQLDVWSIRDIVPYDEDIERAHGIPEPVQALKNAIARASGVWLCTPEYNHSIPGVLKNAIDWTSRPPGDIREVFGDKPVALSGVTRGRGGTRLSQAAWLPVLRALGVRIFTGASLHVSSASKVFDEAGALADTEERRRVREFAAAFVEFTGAAAAGSSS